MYADQAGGQETEAVTPSKRDFTIETFSDASTDGVAVTIHPKLPKDATRAKSALIVLDLKENLKLAPSDLMYVRVCTDHNVIHPTQLRIENDKGAVITRNWVKIKGDGCKLIIFSVKGFHTYESADFSTLTKVGFMLGTADETEYKIDKIEFGVLSNAFQTEALIAAKGNIFAVVP